MSTVGVALSTTSVVVIVRTARCSRSSGVNVTDSVCVPASSTVPAGGEYTNVPGKFAVACNCAAPMGVAYVMASGCGQVIVGVVPTSVTLPCASEAVNASSPGKVAAIASG